MDVKRKAARGIAVLAVALAAGHLVQNMGHKPAPKPMASAQLAQKPTKVETVAAGPASPAPVSEPMKTPALPAAPLAATTMPEAPPVVVETPPAATLTPEPAPKVETTTAPVSNAADPVQLAAQPVCDITFDLMSEPNAIIGITLIAPCLPDQRVVLRQGGLAITGLTTSTGALFTAIPALESQALVEASFGDGTKASANIAIPELSTLRRFGVQWQADDAFQVHAFEGGSTYGGPGHVSAADPHRPTPGLQAKGGFLTLLGDSTTESPLLAEVYTFPANQTEKPEIVVEAAVTDKTCGREMLAETLTSTGGSVFVTDLSLAMPDCDAIGDYLVLKNLVLDLNMAAAN